MTLMSDLFVRGYGFNGETGPKTGADLEDLATRAYPTSGSQLVDQSTIETYSDAGVTDDDSNAINRLRVKDGGITAAKLASGAALGPAVSIAAGSMVTNGSWTTPPSSVANAVDGSDATNWGDAVLPASSEIFTYWDLGAKYKGWLEVVASIWSADVTYNGNIELRYGYDAIDGFTVATASRGTAQRYPALQCYTTSHTEKNHLYLPFHGQYVGMGFIASGPVTSTYRVYQFNVYGQTA